VAAGVAAACASAANGLAAGCAAAGAAGVVLMAVGLTGRPVAGVGLGVALLGVAYAMALADGGRGPERLAPLAAGALLLVAELAYWSLELRSRARAEPGLLGARAALILGLALGGAAVAELLVALGGSRSAEAALPRAVGLAVAAAVLAALGVLAPGRRRPGDPAEP
jgi:hypothetical protein